ncbi:ATP-dependent nuclease [Actinoplanes missouriensis]|uniref:ATP-dependent nuclease n=1 Tax=Actinoplanes missouriensis TaxID=1866 RepID=UPI0036C1DB7B
MQIRQVAAWNFRGIRKAEWRPPPLRFLCLVGAGDSTKSTLLDAVALVLTSRPNVTFSDADFYQCDVSKPIVVRVLIGDLSPALLDAETGFGMWLTGLTPDGQLEHDPSPDAEVCVMAQLVVSSDLEPSWTVVRHEAYDDGLAMTAGKRRALGLFRVDDRADTHLRWGRGSALARMTEGGTDQAVTAVRRASRETVFSDAGPSLRKTADQVAAAAGAIGGGAFANLGPGWDPIASASPSALLLHDGKIPLTHAGLGSRRLISMAAQELATQEGNILLVDEIEHGLEPHRLLHVLHELRKRSGQRQGQVIITTHSPIAVQAMAAADISMVRNDRTTGYTTVMPVPDEIADAQGALRAGPSAILARRVVVGEGATEAGIIRAMIRRWDEERIQQSLPTHAALGATFLNGGGASAPVRAKVYQQLGVEAALLVDNDDRGVDKAIQEAEESGVMVARWQLGASTEAAIVGELNDCASLSEIIDLAVEYKGSDAVNTHLRAELPKLAVDADALDPATWAAACYTVEEIRAGIIAAAGGGSKKEKKKDSNKAWFKREDPGERLGEFIHRRWVTYQTTALGIELVRVRTFVYGEESSDLPGE